MKNLHSQLFPELQAAFPAIGWQRDNEKKSAQLLEFRTEDGPIYLCPSTWQRIRLQRVFRYFRFVPPQLLSRSEQRLLAELLQTAVVTPDLPVEESAVFGVVEEVHGKSRVLTARPDYVDTEQVHMEMPEPPLPESGAETPIDVALPPAIVAADAGLRPWIVSGVAAAAAIVLIMGLVLGISVFSSPRVITNPPVVAVLHQPAALQITAGAAGQFALLRPRKPHLWVTPTSPLPMKPQFLVLPGMVAGPQRRFVSELPPGNFAHPVVDKRDLVGEVRLRASIASDGSVKQVTVLSGNRRLAQAGRRAVMQWHYSPYQVLGQPVAVETVIKMSFFGPDAVSIASVAGAPSS